ncbi:MAG TPA: mechanosensitive ion channel domain-containing protein, partial [Blastocatellia bacterium]|nr:mechanosensitive ion channel domain-containing protein [Blastocatellia bacterium]
MPQYLKSFLFTALALLFTGILARPQGLQANPYAARTGAGTQAPAPATSPASPGPAPVPLADVARRAEMATALLRNTESDSTSERSVAKIEAALVDLSREIDSRIEEDSRTLFGYPPLDTLRTREAGWRKIADDLNASERELAANASQLDKTIADLGEQQQTWKLTRELAQSSPGTPPEVVQSIEALTTPIARTRATVEKRQAATLTLQSRIVQQETRVAEALERIGRARDEAVNRLLVRDSPPLWNAEAFSHDWSKMKAEGLTSIQTELNALKAYAAQQGVSIVLHLLVILALVGAFHWMHRQVQPFIEDQQALKRADLLLARPVGPAIVISIIVSGWIYPHEPPIWRLTLVTVALIPTIIILRKLIEPRLYPILNGLAVFYFIDILRAIGVSTHLPTRLVFLAETFGAVIFLAWEIRSWRSSKGAGDRRRLIKAIEGFARVALIMLAAAVAANVLGFVTIANLVADAVLRSSYLAIILFSGISIAHALVLFALRIRPFTLLGAVRRNQDLLSRRIRKFLQVSAFLVWLAYALELLSLRGPIFQTVNDVLTAEIGIGTLTITLGNVVAFGLAIWAAFLISRLIRFILDEDVYSRLELSRGTPYAISTALNYTILLIGFLIAIAFLGIDMTKFTILAGAFSLGLGFGLQNILNNFVSGLIVLFERPVKVGDIVQTTEATGVVRRIGVRASIISSADGSDVIVPNGKLISDSVINWTLLSSTRRMAIRVGARYGTDPAHVIELLKDVARAHKLVADDPQPQALLTEFGPDSLTFELRAWTNYFDRWEQVRSDLAVAIDSVF